tara:strand:+ start:28 stop:1299 length:1272 start_codon:yes stop_codon:yes gene_type:complete
MIRIKIIKESKSLLQELDYEQVKQRFDSKKFKRAAANPGPRAPIPTYVSPPWSPEKIQSHLATIVQRAVPADITEKDKATALNWLISTAIKTRFTGLSPDVRSQLEIFFQIKQQKLDRFLSKKDINQIKDFSELYDVVNKSRGPYKDHLASKVNPTQAKAGKKLIHSDNEWDVFIPETKAAACSLGKGTNWCTAAPGLDYYNQYHKPDDPLIIFKNKEDPSKDVQFHFGTRQYMDVNDRDIETHTKAKLASLLKGNKFLPEKILDKVNSYDYKDLGDGRTYLKAGSTETWWLNGRYHREDGPAVEEGDGTKQWYLNGVRHREDGPATERSDGTIEWYLNGERHREDGPAYEYSDGVKVWFLNGERHRADGPAVEDPTVDGAGRSYEQWYLNGRKFGRGQRAPPEWIEAGGKVALREVFKKYLK